MLVFVIASTTSFPLLSVSKQGAYKIDLTFQELEPITEDDYTNLDGDTDTQIGF